MKPANILHINSLNEDWCDKGHVMLHACFQLLVDFLEEERICEVKTDWNYDDRHRAIRSEMLALNDWWRDRVRIDEISVAEESLQQKDNEMLVRLIGIRGDLWV